MTKKSIAKLSIFMLVIMMIFSGCSAKEEAKNEQEFIEKTELFMGTVCTVRIYDEQEVEYLDEAFEEIKELEDKMSINIESSEISKVNNSSGKAPVEVSDDTRYVIEKGLEYSKLSEGKFDISIGPLVELWGIGSDKAKVPTQEEIDKALKLIGYDNVEINDNNEVFLKEEGMIIDLGGIAKGYTADKIKEILIEKGVTKAIINMGGNVLTVGSNNNDQPFKIGIQDPYSSRGGYVGIIDVEDKSVVTSGIYERYLEVDGKRYHHILNPFTGYPWENQIAGVSIISDKSIDGDALSTLTFALGVEEGMKFIEEQEGVDAIFITKDKQVYVTSGLEGNFRITDENFTLVQ